MGVKEFLYRQGVQTLVSEEVTVTKSTSVLMQTSFFGHKIHSASALCSVEGEALLGRKRVVEH